MYVCTCINWLKQRSVVAYKQNKISVITINTHSVCIDEVNENYRIQVPAPYLPHLKELLQVINARIQ